MLIVFPSFPGSPRDPDPAFAGEADAAAGSWASTYERGVPIHVDRGGRDPTVDLGAGFDAGAFYQALAAMVGSPS